MNNKTLTITILIITAVLTLIAVIAAIRLYKTPQVLITSPSPTAASEKVETMPEKEAEQFSIDANPCQLTFNVVSPTPPSLVCYDNCSTVNDLCPNNLKCQAAGICNDINKTSCTSDANCPTGKKIGRAHV